ncbi:4-alpha-glucanotransferase [Rhodococcus sp. HNM0563]|uniref:4-alpha-glucanotransferase n=1 Tax=Rhodococcus sp. HNM0563 TaxID=2716339 RepID=UPI00146F1A63|nr:4-alpha-glucanotransferase [Rhodococcus sp. HNM0563]
MTSSDKLRELAGYHGVSCTYRGWDTLEHHVPDRTLRSILAALDVPAGSDAEIDKSLADVPNAPWRQMLPLSLVVAEGDRRPFAVHVPHGDPVSVWVVAEDGSDVDAEQLDVWVEPRMVDGRLVGRATFTVPALPLGWHTIHARSNDIEATATLVVTPARLSTADRVLRSRQWGLAAQLYSVRSSRSWGIGDFADLADLTAVTAGHGGDFVLINPVHAAEPRPPHEPSPYLPSSRRFVDPLYLRVEDIPEAAYLSRKQRRLLDESARDCAKANRKGARLKRNPVFRAKLKVLERIHSVPRGPARQARYAAFCADGGRALDDFALWCALAEKAGPHHWDERATAPDDPWVKRQRVVLAERIDFHRWLQWLCDEQLAAAQIAARAAGMGIGVVHDLAVGVKREGADAWALGDALAAGVTVGAPPDDFNLNGQNWNQPPWRPDRLEELGYGPYREMLRSVLRHAGGVRIDHILGLFRTWWVPEGSSPSEGAYVRYDHEAMIGILVLEAHRADAVVIGEDLGVFEGWVQEYLAERGVAGTSILWFEKDGDTPRAPESYRRLCLTSVTTHDLPPTSGYLAGEHISIRSKLGLLKDDLATEFAAAEAERDAVLGLARDRGLLDPVEGESLEHQVEALHRLVAASPSAMLALSLADAVGEPRSQNQPGTVDEYPNWRVPLADADGEAVLIDDLTGHERFARLAEALSPAEPG